MISVCIPTYNGEKYIKEQLDSIFIQLGAEDEVIISDDSSTDDTIKIIEDLGDSRVKLYKNNIFRNPSYNLENALKHASGDYIFLADQDDVWMENKVEIVLNELKNYPLIISDCKIVDSNLNTIEESFYYLNGTRKGVIGNFVKNGYLGCCMAFDKSVLRLILPFPKNVAMHDIWIGLICGVFNKARFIDNQLILYRRHGENVSFGGGPVSRFGFFYKLKYRTRLIVQIFMRILKVLS